MVESQQQGYPTSKLCPGLSNNYETLKKKHLKDLLANDARNAALSMSFENILLDFSHEKVTEQTFNDFQELVNNTQLFKRIEEMFTCQKINKTEDRAVLHVSLRANEDENYQLDGKNVVEDVHKVLNQIKAFSEQIRCGTQKGYSQKLLKNIVVIGIGGSYLGIEFVYQAIKNFSQAKQQSANRKIRFLANVDPIDCSNALEELNPEETLVLVNSKTFTTAETMLNARTCKKWILDWYAKNEPNFTSAKQNDVIKAHFCACSTNYAKTQEFGIVDERVFGFWDWVGGRFSVCSAIGILPLSVHFGFDIMQQFLKGANSIDKHFRNTQNVKQNIPLMVGLLGFYHITIQGYTGRALLPYCQALNKFAPHIQQLDMESNGKRVTVGGNVLPYETGVINFGEPGTNGQHSFYQLLHQGRTIPCEFIGFCKSQNPLDDASEAVPNHDELMSNFFSQPDALACGKDFEQLKKENCKEFLMNHKFFPGDKPSFSLLIDELSPYTCGQLLAIYEHRTVVEGFLWDINSFDQWGVELGKQLAVNVRNFFQKNKGQKNGDFTGFTFNSSTKAQLAKYLSQK